MCGIAGLWSLDNITATMTTVTGMLDVLCHRGPDDSGVWLDEANNLALGHRRLSILDLSPAGHQPMVSSSGRYRLVLNGEIYNHGKLRAELRGINWRGHSDTETMLAAIEVWGLEETLRRSVGMFALALWDSEKNELSLARDRVGEKPIYYGTSGNTFIFASELKALKMHPGFSATIDRRALALFMRHNYVPAPYSIYEGIFKLSPGSVLTLTSPEISYGPKPYWSAGQIAAASLVSQFAGDASVATDQLEKLLLEAVAGQMVADVPLGAFLSGGYDSSLVVALMQAQSSRPVKTFTIGFDEGAYNEAGHAKRVAEYLGTEHTELYVRPEDALAVIPRLPLLYDEPFADSSQIPTSLVSELARRHVTVSLSGDGGDELFGGYNRYFWAVRIWNRISMLPIAARKAISHSLTCLSPSFWNKAFSLAGPFVPARLRYANPGDKLHKLAGMLAGGNPESLYHHLVSHWNDPAAVVLGGVEPLTSVTDPSAWLASPDFEQRMMYLDLITYLPDDILVKVDRAAMGVSLETRVPFLDHRVVEFAWRMPLDFKIRGTQGKWLLRQVLYRYLPQEIMDRPKMGFGVPIDSWLRGPLRDWAEALLAEDRLRSDGYFNPAPIREKWQEHLSGRRNWQYHLWDVLMFQSWLEAQ